MRRGVLNVLLNWIKRGYTMKRFFLSLFFILGFVAVSLASGNEPQGFNGITWGTNVNAVSGLKFYDEDAIGTKVYVKANQFGKVSLYNAVVDQIYYIFFKGSFYSANVEMQGKSNYLAIRDSMINMYGQPQTLNLPKNNLIEHYWYGAKTLITLSYNSNDFSSYLTYLYRPIAEQMK